jgi:hypothetical protein
MFWNEKQIFEKRLAETIKWCSARLDNRQPRSSLRTIELLPKKYQVLLSKKDSDFNPEDDSKMASLFLNSRPYKLIDEIIKKRSQIINAGVDNAVSSSTTWRLSDGKLLCWNFGNSNADGACQSLSDGFLGFNGDPPWDTWLCHFKSHELKDNKKHSVDYLICWIPFAFIETIDQAIPADCLGTFVWLSQIVEKSELEIPDWLKYVAKNKL